MTFLSPFILWLGVAACIPILIHLLNKRRHKTIQWAAMQFLLKATREARGKKKLRHLLILACRVLAILGLVFAAARPLASGVLGWGAGKVDTVVLILDRSASMEAQSSENGRSMREEAINTAKEAIADLGNPRLILLDSASQEIQFVPSPEVLPDLVSSKATDTTADIPGLLIQAIEYLADSSGNAEIWVASDLQLGDWRVDDDRWAAARAGLGALASEPKLRVIGIERGKERNFSLKLLSARRGLKNLSLDLEITRSAGSRGEVSLPLSSNLSGAGTTQMINLAGQSLKFQRNLPIPDGETGGNGFLTIPADGNLRDNQVFFAYGKARTAQTLVVGGSAETRKYLKLAAAPPGYEGQEAKLIEVEEFGTTSLAEFSLVIWTAELPLDVEITNTLVKFLESGGQVLALPPSNPGPSVFLGTSWDEIELAENEKFFVINEWDQADGPLRNSVDGQVIPAERLRAIRRSVAGTDAAVLARWEDGEPFLTRKIIERGALWTLGSLPDYKWSNLGDADVLLPVVQRILAQGMARFESAYLGEVETGDIAKGERIKNGQSTVEDTNYQAGVFRINDSFQALNRPSNEDDLEIVSEEQLARLLEGTDYHYRAEQGGGGNRKKSSEVWRFFLVGLLLFLLAEAILSLPKPRSPRAAKA